MKDITKKYTNGEITVVWKPSICIHSTICWKNATGLPSVFNPAERPWIKPEGATTQEIINQVNKCPSGAISYYKNEDGVSAPEVNVECIAEVMPDGPLLVYGNLSVKHSNGDVDKRNNVTAFCRCGASANKPFCDGSHKKIEFKG